MKPGMQVRWFLDNTKAIATDYRVVGRITELHETFAWCSRYGVDGREYAINLEDLEVINDNSPPST